MTKLKTGNFSVGRKTKVNVEDFVQERTSPYETSELELEKPSGSPIPVRIAEREREYLAVRKILTGKSYSVQFREWLVADMKKNGEYEIRKCDDT